MTLYKEIVKFTTWRLLTQVKNSKNLAGIYYNLWILRFNWILRRKTYQGLYIDEG